MCAVLTIAIRDKDVDSVIGIIVRAAASVGLWGGGNWWRMGGGVGSKFTVVIGYDI